VSRSTWDSAVPDVPNARTVVDVLRWRAHTHGERIACTFLIDGEREESHLTYADLERRARSVAADLVRAGARGERALLFLPSGLDFVAAFFGCLYAGTLAVPFSPLRRRVADQAHAVIDDAGARFALTTGEGQARLERDEWCRVLHTVVVDGKSSDVDVEVTPSAGSDVAYLQYTSGSTRRPRGVTIRHGQLLQHVDLVWRTFNQDEQSVVVSWLPLFHDMGLVGALVSPLVFGARTILLSPWHFLTRPMRWLDAVSRHRATTSGAPNFAYDLCVARSTPEDRQSLDLTRWATAFNGAEPVRASTLDRFTTAFEPQGFRRSAFRPCYGLAEATLLVTADGGTEPPVIRHVGRRALEAGRIEQPASKAEDTAALVGCGPSQGQQSVRIVDPESHVPLGDRQVGEIWVAGPGLSTHYWNDRDDQPTFGARTSDGDGPWLRTGDLGFLDSGELFITGRLKDLLTIRGRNYHAADLEESFLNSLPALAAARCAVFSIDDGDEEALVVVQELPRAAAPSPESIVDAIRRVTSQEFGLSARSIVIVRAGGIPRTSSGKTMRHACRQLFLSGELPVVTVLQTRDRGPAGNGHSFEAPVPGSYVEMVDHLRQTLAAVLLIEPVTVRTDRAFADFGVSSLQLAELAGDLERDTGKRLDPSVLYAHPTIDSLARYLATDGDARAAGRLPAAAEAIAITGLACRLPGAPDAESFWALLRDGTDAITEVPPDRWNVDQVYDSTLSKPGTTNTKWGGFLTRVDMFDASFFGISDAEADGMDPQQRLLLETSCEALEDAGIPLDCVKGTRTGVFVGISTNDYSRLTGASRARTDVFWSTGSALSIAANRISYSLDLHGPSIAVDTACSSSLVALHLACRSLGAGESELALVGGVNLMLSPEITINMSQAGATSGDGRCKAFDARADGLVRGEGVGIVVLKPLSKALRDRDRIYALVRGTAINQDGATNGLTAPNPRAQAEVIRDAYDAAGVVPQSVQYVETHGPGTVLGDPIELQALASVVGGPERTEACRVGSVKTNIGHLEAAAGIAGVIKVALALRHGHIPPSLHFAVPNPRIAFASLKLSVVTRLEPWTVEEGVRRAGVSAFGFGGTNAHAVLEAAPPPTEPTADARPATEPFHVLQLSARSQPALKELASAYCDHLPQSGEASLGRVVRAAAARRTHHVHRLAVVGRSAQDIVRRIEGFLDDNPDPLVYWGKPVAGASAGPVFVFSGFEAAPAARFHGLLRYDAFRRQVDACDVFTRQLGGWSIADAVKRGGISTRGDDDEADAGLARIQLRLFTVQTSMAALWRAWGVEPAAVVGHSIGEVAAAHVAGALGLPDAFAVLYERSRLLEKQLAGSPGHGAMAAVRLSVDDTRKHLERFDGPVEIAAHNGPSLTVCAGRRDALDRFLGGLADLGVTHKLLALPGPGHTSFVEPIQQELVDSLARLSPRSSTVPIFSTATGVSCDGATLDGTHWGRHLRAPVSFMEAIASAIAGGYRLFLEIGAIGSLSPCIAGVLRDAQHVGIAAPSLREQQDPLEALACAAAQLFVSGSRVAWGERDAPAEWVALPRYPWQRRRHWVAVPTAAPGLTAAGAGSRGRTHPFLGVRMPGAPHVACWQRELDPASTPWLRDHRVGGVALMPATAYLRLAADAAAEAHGIDDLLIEDVEFERSLFVPVGETRLVQTTLQDDREGGWRFDVHASSPDRIESADNWIRLTSGRVVAGGAVQPPDVDGLSAIRARAVEPRDPASMYDGFRLHGIAYGPSLARVEKLWRLDEREALARVQAPDDRTTGGAFDPGALDACLQPMGLTISAAEISLDGAHASPAFLPARIRRVWIRHEFPDGVWSHVSRRPSPSPASPFDGTATIFDDAGRVIAAIDGFSVAATAPATPFPLLRVTWQPRDSTAATRRAGRWLIVQDQRSIAQMLARAMQERGVEADVCQLVDGGLPSLDRVAGVVDLRAVAGTLEADAGGEGVARAVAMNCGFTLETLRAIANRSDVADAPALWTVTRGAVAVRTNERPSLAQHPLWSLARTAAVEEARIWGGIVDLDPDASEEQNAGALCAVLIDADDEDQVALRGGRRYVARLAPAEPSSARGGQIRASATYLVTGGLGELGLEVARWLVQQGARRLILLGRTGLPPRVAWRSLDGTPAARAVDVIRGLESRGATIHLAQADVSSAADLSACLDAFRREAWPDIAGVFHLAGCVRPSGVRDLDESILMEHFSAKVAGAWNLHRYFRNTPLDVFVLFSSGSAVLGSPGIGAYGTANAFLDALAAHHSSEGHRAVSINWGFWSEAGMAARVLRASPDRPVPRGMRALPNREALRILGTLLNGRHTSVAVMPFDWDDWSAAHPATASRPYLRLLTTARADLADAASISSDEILAAPPDARAAMVERYLCDRLARLLQVEVAQLVRDAPLTQLGIDSLMAVELKNRVEADLRTSVPIVALLQGGSIATLARVVLTAISGSSGQSEPQTSLLESLGAEEAKSLLSQLDQIPAATVDRLIDAVAAGGEGLDAVD
jgi:acyl transferase domain-containing protein/acyl-CoA synthetase (AMP-forming)/AMP-acid ligase II/acyl carrier protein